MRTLAFALATGLLSTSAFAGATTTRIETRPYYGAVVTVEQGVRVWRPLPPHGHVIIDPRGQARVNVDVGSAPVPYAPAVVNQYSQVIAPAPLYRHHVGIPRHLHHFGARPPHHRSHTR
jgi:hypothetical protein